MCAVAPDDAGLYTEWMGQQGSAACLDPKVLAYPRSCMTRVMKGQETLMMFPMHPTLMLESLAKKPGITEWQEILGLDELDKVVTSAMQVTGMCEAFFLTSVERFADTAESHGWTKALYDPAKKTWLMKKQIEPPKCE